MKKYFLLKQQKMRLISDIIPDEIIAYRASLIIEMQKLGATEDELALICDATIRNSIRNNRKPEDVAWAILQ